MSDDPEQSRPAPTPNDVAAFHRAVAGDDIAAVIRYLDKYDGAIINRPGRKGQTALMQAVLFQQMAMVDLLLERGAEVDQADDEGATALTRAAQWGYHGIARVLLEKGADANHRDAAGKSVLDHAVTFGQEDTVGVLLRRGAKDKQSIAAEERIRKLREQKPQKPVFKKQP